MYATKDEARKALQELMLEKGVLSVWPWDKVKRAISDDPRFNALRRENEKKQVQNR